MSWGRRVLGISSSAGSLLVVTTTITVLIWIGLFIFTSNYSDFRVVAERPWTNHVFEKSGIDHFNESARSNHVVKRSWIDHVPDSRDSAGQSVKVLVLAYFRSGSTFTSQALAKLDNSFFVFEPLHVMENFLLQTNNPLTFLNGSTRPPLTSGYEIPFVVQLLRALLNCEFEKVDTVTLEVGFLPEFTWQIKSYLDCVGNSSRGMSNELMADCLGQLKRSCLKASIRVIKTIRLRMRTTEEILKSVPDLKVLHLLRDPRGQYVSAREHSLVTNHNYYQQKVCNLASEDIRVRLRLESTYPTTYKEVIYEDLIHHPEHTLSAVYTFIGQPLPRSILEWMHNVTFSASETPQYLFGDKKNATRSAYSWVSKCPWKHVQFFQKRCGWLLRHGRFPIIASQAEQVGFVIPHRGPPV